MPPSKTSTTPSAPERRDHASADGHAHLPQQTTGRLESATASEHEQHYQWLYDNTPSMYFTLSPEGTVLSANRYGAEQLGYRQEELVGQSVLAVFDPADHRTVRDQLTACAQHIGTTLAWEIMKVRKDGSRLWVGERARAVFNHHGRLILLIVCEDITDRKQAETALRESEERFRQIAETIEEVVWAADPSIGRILYISPAYERVWGRTCASLYAQPKSFIDAIHPDDRARVLADLAAQRDGLPFAHEYRVVQPDGEIRWVWDRGFPVVDHTTGVLTHYVGVALDITNRKLTEEALRASELRLQHFVAEAPVGLVILDNQRRLLTVNRAFCALTGYGEQDLIGRTYDFYTHPADLPASLALSESFYQGTRSEYSLEKRYVTKSGDIIWVSVKATNIALPNHPGPLLLAVIQDVTAQRQASEERERISQDLHDNILQSLYAVGMQLEASKLSLGTSSRKSKIHTTQAVDQLNRLVIDVRQYFALLKQPTAPTMDFGQALRHLVASFSAADLAAPELEIKDPVIPMITPEQGEQLLNIVREALSNSVRHAEAAHRWVRLSHAGSAVRMEICDDGIGFEPKRKRKHGHGLSNMAARAKRIRARFILDSRPRAGTRIIIDLPLEDQP